ncbi:MAG: hypothetical protein HY791_10280 [Deltaproteobacteria bacterium]|nr:hypothetical protein [Deltaproteobacteria bacterium]
MRWARTAFLTMGLWALAPTAAVACKFAPRPMSELVASAEAAFVGRVVSVEESGSEVSVRFRVSRRWRGADESETSIRIPTHSCGIRVEKGQDWLILAAGKPLATWAGAGNHLLSDASGKKLGEIPAELLRLLAKK